VSKTLNTAIQKVKRPNSAGSNACDNRHRIKKVQAEP